MKNFLVLGVCLAAAIGCKAAEVRAPNGPGSKVAPPRPAVSDVLPSDVIGAVSNVMAVSHLVGRSRDLCAGAFPSSQKKFTLSAQSWQQRNATVLVLKVRLMAPDEQVLVAAALNSDALRKTDDMLRPVMAGSSAEKTKWCQQAFMDVDRGRLDLVGRASIVPLMRYAR